MYGVYSCTGVCPCTGGVCPCTMFNNPINAQQLSPWRIYKRSISRGYFLASPTGTLHSSVYVYMYMPVSIMCCACALYILIVQ